MHNEIKIINFATEKDITHKILEIMKRLFISMLMVMAVTAIKAQAVYSCEYTSDADVKVYVSDYKSDADLVVYKCDYKSDARGNEGLWYFCKYKSDAKKKIYFTKYKSDAHLVIYFSKYKSDAGWKNKSKQHLMY